MDLFEIIGQVFGWLQNLKPMELSVTMFSLYIIDIWLALRLTVTNRTILSKALIKGWIYNLIMVLSPFILGLLQDVSGPSESNYIQVLALFFTVVFVSSVATSIVANYAAAYPSSYNWLTKLVYEYLPEEVRAKQEKHGITHDGDGLG